MSKIEQEIEVQGIASVLADKFGVERIPTFESRPAPSVDDLTFLSEKGRNNRGGISVGPVIVARGIPFVVLCIDQENGQFDVMLLTMDHGWQAIPPNPNEAFKFDERPDLDEALNWMLTRYGLVLDSPRVGEWFRGCCEMNGLEVPDYAREVQG